MADPPKYEFAKLDLKAGDILCIKTRDSLGQYTMDLLRDKAAELIPEGVSVLVIGPTLDVLTITREQAGPLIEGKGKPKAKAKA